MTDHHDLTKWDDYDDHTQYHNNARGDARYLRKAGFGVQVYSEADLRSSADFAIPVFVTGDITLTVAGGDDLHTTCPLFIAPGSKITLNGVRLTEAGPHLSTGSYQQYVVPDPYEDDNNVIYAQGGGLRGATKEVLVSWFGNNSLAFKYALRSTMSWTEGRRITFTPGVVYDLTSCAVITDDTSCAAVITASGARFTGAFGSGAAVQFRNTYSGGSKLWVWDGGYFENTSLDYQGKPNTGRIAFKFMDTRLFEVKNVHIESFDTGMEADNTESMNIHDNMFHKCSTSIMTSNTHYDPESGTPHKNLTTQNLTVTQNLITTEEANLDHPGGSNDHVRTAGIVINQRPNKLRITGNTFGGTWSQGAITVYDQATGNDCDGQLTQGYEDDAPAPAPEITGNHIEHWAANDLADPYAIKFVYRAPDTASCKSGFAAVRVDGNNITSVNKKVSSNAVAIKLQGVQSGTVDNNEIFFGGTAGYAFEVPADGDVKTHVTIGSGNHYVNVNAATIIGSTALTSAPANPVQGMTVQADGTGWDPLSRGSGPYMAWYDGSAWRGLAYKTDADTLDGSHASAFAVSGHGHADATTSAAGFMSSVDKDKLDGIASGAVAAHGALSGLLTGDDHTQYYNQSRGDARYLQLSGGALTGSPILANGYLLKGKDTGGTGRDLIGKNSNNQTVLKTESGYGFYFMFAGSQLLWFAANGQIHSAVATGTAPFSVDSTTEVANLDANKVGGYTASQLAKAGYPHVADVDSTSISTLTGSMGTTGTDPVDIGASYSRTNANDNDRRLMDQINNLKTVVDDLRTKLDTIMQRLESSGLLQSS